MKRLLFILMCVCVISMTQADIVVTNGDFETGLTMVDENKPDVTDWYDNSTANFWENAWQSNASWITPNGTAVVVFCAWNTVEGDSLAGSYLYQSVGTSTGESSVTIGFDWGHPDDVAAGRHDGLTVSMFASDGSFVPGDAVDIYGAAGVTLLDSASYDHIAAGTDGEIWSVSVDLDTSLANVGDELFLRFNNYLAGGTDVEDPWPVLDNVIPEPATLALLGLGGLLLRRKR